MSVCVYIYVSVYIYRERDTYTHTYTYIHPYKGDKILNIGSKVKHVVVWGSIKFITLKELIDGDRVRVRVPCLCRLKDIDKFIRLKTIFHRPTKKNTESMKHVTCKSIIVLLKLFFFSFLLK